MTDYEQSLQTIGILRGLFLVHPTPEETPPVPDVGFDGLLDEEVVRELAQIKAQKGGSMPSGPSHAVTA